MKIIRNIVQSSEAPVNTNDLWLNKGTLMYFNGTWIPLDKTAYEDELGEKVDSLDKEVGNLAAAIPDKMTGITESTATDVAGLKTDLNNLISKMTTAGFIE